MTIPAFPKFKKLELSDKNEIEKYTLSHPPSSDYNFLGLWTYNVDNEIVISHLKNNLIIKFSDYLTNEPFFSFFGVDDIPYTINTLLEYAKQTKALPYLKLIPEYNLINITNNYSNFYIKEDIDNFDYIYSIEELADLTGSKYKKKRNLVNRFNHLYEDYSLLTLNLNESELEENIRLIFQKWTYNKHKSSDDSEHELKALSRIFKNYQNFNILCFILAYRNSLIGFTIIELLNTYAMCHFTKADTAYVGVYETLYNGMAKVLHNRHIEFLNREQDMGLSGLRQAKKDWNPINYLKKYIIYPI